MAHVLSVASDNVRRAFDYRALSTMNRRNALKRAGAGAGALLACLPFTSSVTLGPKPVIEGETLVTMTVSGRSAGKVRLHYKVDFCRGENGIGWVAKRVNITRMELPCTSQ